MPLPAMSKVTKYEKAARLLRYVSRRLLALVCLGISGALLSASLVRFAPGYGVQERELDPRWSAQSVEALRKNQPLQEGHHRSTFNTSRRSPMVTSASPIR